MLAELYLARAECYQNLAGDCARQALELEPEKKANHAALAASRQHAERRDWCGSNYTEPIDYYRDFTARHPDYEAGYWWYLDNLIRDRRLDEAREVLEKMRAVRAYEQVLAILRDDWGLTEGETVEGYRENIRQLR